MNKKIEENKNKKIYLLDTSVFCRIEEMFRTTNVNLFYKLSKSDKVTFLISTDVIKELFKSPEKRVVPFNLFFPHIINSNMSFSVNKREKLTVLPVMFKNEPFALKINAISYPDAGQILLCQGEKDLILVSNDKNMLKAAIVVLGKNRVMGTLNFLEDIYNLHLEDEELRDLFKTVKRFWRFKNLFGKQVTLKI